MRLTTIVITALFLGILFAATTYAADTELPVSQELKLINALGCKGCHIIGSSGATIASNLNQVGSRLTTKQIDIHLRTQRKSDEDLMPGYKSLSAEERQQISDFLYNLH